MESNLGLSQKLHSDSIWLHSIYSKFSIVDSNNSMYVAEFRGVQQTFSFGIGVGQHLPNINDGRLRLAVEEVCLWVNFIVKQLV